MSEPFLAEIRIMGFNFAPRGWAFCDGQILPINQNQALYSLLGTTYGGDGQTSFALPDFRGRTPIHTGQSTGGTNHTLGQKGGEETHTLTNSEMPQHRHPVNASEGMATSSDPTGQNWGKARERIYAEYSTATATPMHNGVISNTGGGQAHENMQPYLVMNYCIALQGIFPSRN